MSKYINADTVIQALRNTIDKHKDSEMFTRTVRAAENMITIINRMPSADVVEVVRCKDCIKYKSFENENYPCGECGNCSYDVPPKIVGDDDYCSEGERRETNE